MSKLPLKKKKKKKKKKQTNKQTMCKLDITQGNLPT